jgi:hypothetical protein
MSVLTPEQARKILANMAEEHPALCDQCSVPFSDSVELQKVDYGPFPIWLCAKCRERNASQNKLEN